MVGRCIWSFFFQAEDGIRDIGVTGVQTCALPISTQTAGFCESWVESDTAGTELLRLDYKTATPEQIELAIKRFWSEQEPILVFLEQQAPDEIRPDVATLLRLARQGRMSGDPVALLSPELKRADDNIDSFMLQRCDFIQLQVVATDHSYGGLPT